MCIRDSTWATAYTLAQAIHKIGAFDVILCGKQAIDGDTGQVGPGIARQLGITQLTYVFKIQKLEPATGVIVVERLLEEGREVVEAKLPVVLTVVKDINQPRYPTFLGIRRATKMQVPTWGAADFSSVDMTKLGLKGSPTQVVKIFSPPRREGRADMISADSVDDAAAILANKLLAEKVL
jgi:electron transfer flavoprotein alpha/beta subunit